MNWFLFFIALVGGTALGIVYFGGLWLTVRDTVEKKRSVWLLIGSFLLRTGILLLVFYALVIQHWAYLIVAFTSFLVVRHFILNRMRKSSEALYD